MKYRLIKLALLTGIVLFFAACNEQVRRISSVDNGNGTLGTLEGVCDYLVREPAVRTVEIWENPYGPGLHIRTRHYSIYTTLMDPLMLRQVPAFVESAYNAYQNQLPQRLPSNQLFKVYLFDTREQWEAFTQSFMGQEAEVYLKIQEGAYTANGVCVAYNIGRKQTFSVIGHEGWHQFNQHLFVYRLPSWLDEGIATLFETCRYSQGRFVFEPGRNLMRLWTLKETIQQNHLIPLDHLIVLNPGQVLDGYGDDQDAIVAFYAQNYALVRFLREHNYGIRLRKYHAMLLGGANGTWPLNDELARQAADRNMHMTVGWNMTAAPALFDYYFNEDIRQLDKEYRAYCQKIVYPVHLKK